MPRSLTVLDGSGNPTGLVVENWADGGSDLYQVRWAGTGHAETRHLPKSAALAWLNQNGYTCPALNA